jgi:hypothetical protein
MGLIDHILTVFGKKVKDPVKARPFASLRVMEWTHRFSIGI